MRRWCAVSVWVLGAAVACAGGCGARSSKPVAAIDPQPAATVDALADAVQLTSGFERAGEAYFSPDMRWIVFQATPPGEQQYQMYVARLLTTWSYDVATGGHELAITGIETPIRVSPADSRNTCGWFSPDGQTLIFSSTAGKEDPAEASPGYQRQGSRYQWAYPKGMEVFRADNWRGAVEAVGPGGSTDLAQHALTDNLAYDAEGSMSPDGRWIVFTSNRTGDLELFAMRADGSGVVQLTSIQGYDGGPFFSPDGRRLVYRSDRAGNDLLQVFVADVVYDGQGNITGLTSERQLTSDVNVNWGPFWHPNGKRIYFATSVHGHTNYEIYSMSDTGDDRRRITATPGPDVLPAISPDGQWMLWASKRGGDKTQVWVARIKP